MKMKKNSKRPHRTALLPLYIFCILVIIVQSGCSLAKVDSTGKDSKDDVLCGVWIVSGKDGEEMDMNAFSADNANTLLLYLDNKNGERFTMSEVSGSIQSDLHFNTVDGKTTTDYFGTLLVSPDHVTSARIYSIYQRPDGTRYAGNDLIPVTVDPMAGGSNVYAVESDKIADSDGTANMEAIRFQITFIAHSPSESVKVIEFGKNNQILKTNSIDLSRPDTEEKYAFNVEASAETEYIIVEETGTGSDGKITRTVYNRDNFSAENPFCYTLYQSNEDGLLNPLSLHITFKSLSSISAD